MTALRRVARILPGVLFIAVALCALEYLVQTGRIRRALFPPPSVIGTTLWDLLASGDFLQPLGTTMVLFALGYVLAVISGVVLGLLMGSSRTVAYLLDPLIESIRPMPKAALLPVLMLYCLLTHATSTSIPGAPNSTGGVGL